MKLWKRILSLALSLLMVFAVFPEIGIMENPVKTAAAAGAGSDFTAVEFGQCYAAVLLSQVGKGYEGGAGYHVNGTYYGTQNSRVTAGTPYAPTTIGDSKFDCHSLAITALMAMGYDYFVDANGKQYPLNAMYGGSIFGEGGSTSHNILYDHGTGDVITLHHSNNQKYTIKFKLGEIADKSNVDDVKPGTLIFVLDHDKSQKLTAGSFTAHQIRWTNHSAVGLFSMDKLASDDSQATANWANNNRDRAATILENTWNAAYNTLVTDSGNQLGIAAMYTRIYGGSLGSKLTGGSLRNTSSADSTGAKWTPFLWDARGRGFATATSTSYKRGFSDGHANPHFNTPYSSVWQIEALNPNLGVSVNNNPNGKALFRMAVDLEPIYEYGRVVINKTDSGSGSKLTGAKFDLYEWSETQGKYVLSSDYKISETETGVYRSRLIDGSEGDILITGENLGRIRVVETQAPSGYVGGWSEEHQFTGDGETITWTVTAPNDAKVGLHIHKTGVSNAALSGAVFTLYSNEACTTVATDLNGTSTFTSGSTGNTGDLTFRLSSSAQTFYLKETTAPSGYKAEDAIYRITVSAASTGTIVIAKKVGSGSWANVKTITAANAKAFSDSFDVNNPPLGTLRLQKGAMSILSGRSGSVSESAVGGYTFTTSTVTVGAVNANSPLYGKTVTYEVKVKGGSVLSGQTYKEYNSSGTQVGSSKTIPSNGRVTFTCGNYVVISGLEYATYTITEITAPSGWTLNSTSKDVVIDATHQNPTGQIDDAKQTISVSIKKVAADGTTPLAGGLFGLYCTTAIYANDGTVLVPADSVIDVRAAGSDGTIPFPKSLIDVLPNGKTYYVKELKAPDGYYLLSGKQAEFTYGTSAVSKTITNTPVSVNFRKLAAASGTGFTVDSNGLAATFTIYRTNGTVYTTVTTAASGKEVSFAGFTGTLYMLETTAPAGYQKNTNLYEISVGANGVTTVTLYKKGGSGLTFQSIGYTKTSTVQSISSASKNYDVYDIPLGDLEIVKSYNTLLSGASKGSFVNSGDSAAVGKYTVTTVTQSLFDGYGNANSIFYNKYATFTIKAAEAIKDANGDTIYASGAVLSGIAYDLVDKNGTVVSSGTTTASGEFQLRAGTKAVLKNLPLGKYTVAEASAPAGSGYTVAAAQTTTVLKVNDATSYSFADSKQTMTVSILKKNGNTGAAISGGLFGIYCTTDIYDYTGTTILIPKNTVFQIVTAGSDGKASFDAELLRALPNGKTFKVVEIKAPSGYIRTTAEQVFVYAVNTTKELTINNTQLVDISFTKTLTSLLSGKSGSWDRASVGEHTYNMVSKDVFTVGTNSPFYGQTVTFKITAGELVQDIDGNTLYTNGASIANVTCQIVNAAGTATNATTNANGEITFPVGSKVIVKGLPYGTYKATEISAPAAYTLNGTAVTVTGAAPSASVTNTKKTYSAIVRKLDEKTSTPISGGLFGLYCTTDIYDYTGATVVVPKDTVLAIRTAAADGTMEFGDIVSLLPYGKSYYVKEIEAPEGYRLSEKRLSFTYTATGAAGTYSGELPNLPLGNIKVVKTGSLPQYVFTDKLLTEVTFGTEELAGAVYEVYVGDEDILFEGVVTTYQNPAGTTVSLTKNTLVATITSGADGTAVLSDLPIGGYVVKEKASPSENYKVSVVEHETVIASAKQTATVNENNELVPLAVKVIKKDEESGAVLADAVIGIFTTSPLWNEGAGTDRYEVEVDGVTYALLMVRTTDSDGIADFSDVAVPYSEADKLVVLEIEAPEGYLRDDAAHPVKDVVVLENESASAEVTIQDKPFNIMGTRATSRTNDKIQQQAAVSKESTITLMDNVYFSQNPSTTDWRLFIAGYNQPAEIRDLKVVGKLVNAKTGEFLKDKNGNEIVGETVVSASNVETLIDDETGQAYFRVKVKFENVDTSALAGATIVMFEYVYLGNGAGNYELFSQDTNIANLAETLYFPSIGTTFANLQTPGNEPGISGEKTPFEDTCHVENIIVGQTYRLDAKVWDKTAGEFIEVDGKEVLGTLTFTSAATTEDRVVAFTLNTLGLEDHDLVCYEYLYLIEGAEETLIVSEENPDVVKQTKSVTRIQLPSTGRKDVQMWYFVSILLMLLGLALGAVGVYCRKTRKEVA